MTRETLKLCLSGACLLLAAMPAHAQDEDELLIGDAPIETVIAGRPVALRLRGEVMFTDDADDLLSEDISYARFPTELYAGEVRLYQANRFSTAVAVEQWENEQDLDTTRLTWYAWVPVRDAWRLFLRFRKRTEEGLPDTDYYYIGASRGFAKAWYSYTQYRYKQNRETDENESEHQLSQYLTYHVSNGFRLGGEGGATLKSDEDAVGPWYVRGFTSFFLLEELTSLHLEAQHYESSGDLEFQEYESALYQRLGGKSLLRLGYRYYTDNQDLSSHGIGAKLKHFFAPRFAGHVGYRYYDHSEGEDFSSLFGGFSLIL